MNEVLVVFATGTSFPKTSKALQLKVEANGCLPSRRRDTNQIPSRIVVVAKMPDDVRCGDDELDDFVCGYGPGARIGFKPRALTDKEIADAKARIARLPPCQPPQGATMSHEDKLFADLDDLLVRANDPHIDPKVRIVVLSAERSVGCKHATRVR